jgi:hypothetical protein
VKLLARHLRALRLLADAANAGDGWTPRSVAYVIGANRRAVHEDLNRMAMADPPLVRDICTPGEPRFVITTEGRAAVLVEGGET